LAFSASMNLKELTDPNLLPGEEYPRWVQPVGATR
jgi:hypothetical protein